MSDSHFAWQPTRVSAFRRGDRLLVSVEGMKPAPCFDVWLGEYEEDPASTPDVQLGLYWRPGQERCPEQASPYTAHIELNVRGREIQLVRVYHADSYTDLRIERTESHPPGARESEGVVRIRPVPD